MIRWYRVVMSVMTLVLAAALIWQAADIYFKGNAPENILGDGVYARQVYRSEDIRSRLLPLAAPAALWLALAVGGGVVLRAEPPTGAREKMKHIPQGRLTVPRVAVGVLAVGLIVLGVVNGGLRDVLIKAINICTECIGLG